MSQIAETIREFVLSNYLPGESPQNLKNDTPLRTTGVLDSVATLALVDFVEREFGIQVEAYETDVDNFDRIDDIVAFIERKRAGA